MDHPGYQYRPKRKPKLKIKRDGFAYSKPNITARDVTSIVGLVTLVQLPDGELFQECS